jgi:hypothetical protein
MEILEPLLKPGDGAGRASVLGIQPLGFARLLEGQLPIPFDGDSVVDAPGVLGLLHECLTQGEVRERVVRVPTDHDFSERMNPGRPSASLNELAGSALGPYPCPERLCDFISERGLVVRNDGDGARHRVQGLCQAIRPVVWGESKASPKPFCG